MVRGRVIATLLILGGVAFVIGGVIEWRMVSSPPACPPGLVCFSHSRRMHPLRAEVLWAAGGLSICAAAAIRWGHWRARRPNSSRDTPNAG